MTFEQFKTDASRWGVLRSLINRLWRRAQTHLGIHIHVVRVKTLDKNFISPSVFQNLRFKEISPTDLIEASNEPDLQLSREFVESAIEREDYAFGVFDGPLLVSYIWRARGVAPHDGNVWVRVCHPYNYTYKSYTRPSHRGQRISPALHLFSDSEMHKRGYTHRAGFVAVHNTASLAMSKYMGSKIIGKAGYLDWFGRQYPFRTPSVKKIGFEFFVHIAAG